MGSRRNLKIKNLHARCSFFRRKNLAQVGKYDHPTDPDFRKTLLEILPGAFKKDEGGTTEKAVDTYIAKDEEDRMILQAYELYREYTWREVAEGTT